jgi:hypothetical protein|tara:strand:- start:69 stop:395 length:327 start_codon:yes stop_codon:yes gene_type:complete
MMYSELSNRQKTYIDAIVTEAPALGIDTNKGTFSRAELRQVSMATKGKKWIPNWITHDVSRRADRGVFTIPEVMEAMAVQPGHGIEGDELADTTTTTVMEQEDVMVTA